ncbi:MAG: metallophosphoesterase, partial [Bacteroidota bacterium]
MKINRVIIWILVVSVIGIFLDSCKKQEPSYEQPNLEVSFPRMKLRHDLYYQIDHAARSIEIIFSETLEPGSVPGNIALRDQTGSLEGAYDIDVSGAVVWLLFHPDFKLKDGWLYELTLSNGIRSVNRHTLRSSETVELRTTAKPFGVSGIYPGGDTIPSNSIAVISDIHLGDERATAGDYCWFGKNQAALESFLDLAKTGGAIKQLVIQGDLFDEWIIPFDVKPFDHGLGVNNSREYFASVAESPVNQFILEKLRAIAADPEIDLVYIPGNHDMLLTQEIL